MNAALRVDEEGEKSCLRTAMSVTVVETGQCPRTASESPREPRALREPSLVDGEVDGACEVGERRGEEEEAPRSAAGTPRAASTAGRH